MVKTSRKLKLIFAVGLIPLLLFSLAGPALAQGPQAAPLGRYIVVTQDGAVNGAVSRAAMENGGVTLREFTTTPGLVVLIPERALEKIQRVHGVVNVYADPIVTIQAPKPPATPKPEVLPWGIDRIDADQVWDRDGNLILDAGAITGLGVKVAVIDTGIDKDHPDLKANIKGGRNFVFIRGRINPDSWDDDNGHGSHVAGIIAAVENSEGVIGVAPQASLYGVKVLSKTGSGYLSDVVSGIEWSIDPNGDGDNSDHMDVINMSLGTTADYQPLRDAVSAANATGIVVVAAAGNANGGAVNYPGAYPEAIAVSATDSNNAIASFSSTGPEIDLAAPGASIYSTYKGGGYATLSGTSMAAPHVAGTAALVIASGVTGPDQVRAQLQNTADDMGAAGPDNQYGYGLVDAEEAVTGI
ncbi:MAG: S8 family peptidase [Chloroflexi bacterium]|nr:S8 family peptidase [Chloroflexota bacterium]